MTRSFIISSKCYTAGLQKYHVDEGLPVINKEIDFPGPKYITDKRQQKLEKAYICLYTYALTKALHLEVREGLDTTTFLCLDISLQDTDYLNYLLVTTHRTSKKHKKKVKLSYDRIFIQLFKK